MVLKQTQDGHVLTILTTQDHVISLVINDSTPTLSLSGGSSGVGSGRETSGTIATEKNVFTPIVSYIACPRSMTVYTISRVINKLATRMSMRVVPVTIAGIKMLGLEFLHRKYFYSLLSCSLTVHSVFSNVQHADMLTAGGHSCCW